MVEIVLCAYLVCIDGVTVVVSGDETWTALVENKN